jgi:8-oxo-dGTP diphosphatase
MHTTHPKPNQVELLTIAVLENAGQYLLLKRSPSKQFAPNLWTGIGGHVEPDEYNDLAAAALRELREESGILPGEIEVFTLRRVLFLSRPGGPLVLLLYYTGRLLGRVTPDCPEGTLEWIGPERIPGLEMIETTRAVLPLLLSDLARDPSGNEPVRLGVAAFEPTGRLVNLLWT